jgi:DMSO/TMAO reductase YedYZ molybdopterin-dependent catalytic subunit
MLILSRRAFLGGSLAAAAWGQQPEVSAFDLSLLDDWLTPVESFFVREHFPAPKVSAHGWTLQLGGAVAAPTEIAYEELVREPRKALPVTLECAENPVGGGLVSHAEWTGVTLDSLLQRAQPLSEARAVRFVAADGYARSIPLAKARHADTLIAHGMNGERLPEKHGFPLRAIVPGWYGWTLSSGCSASSCSPPKKTTLRWPGTTCGGHGLWCWGCGRLAESPR